MGVEQRGGTGGRGGSGSKLGGAWRVAECMTRSPVVVEEDTHLSDLYDLMEKRRILHVPVVKNGELVGLITERHLRDALPSILTLRDPIARRRSLAVTRVQDVCIRNPVTIESDADILVAIARMRDFRGGSLPVVDRNELVGILTAGDLIRLLERILKGG